MEKDKGLISPIFFTITDYQATYLLIGNILQFLDNIFDKIMHWGKNIFSRGTSIKLASLKC